jgi:hypothetical protein
MLCRLELLDLRLSQCLFWLKNSTNFVSDDDGAKRDI